MSNRVGSLVGLAVLLATVLVVAGSCADTMPGQIDVTVTSQPAVDGKTGDLYVEVHAKTATGDLRGLWVERNYVLASASPFTITMTYVSPGDDVVVAWLDANGSRATDTQDVVSSCACPSPVTVPPSGTVAATVDLDTVVP